MVVSGRTAVLVSVVTDPESEKVSPNVVVSGRAAVVVSVVAWMGSVVEVGASELERLILLSSLVVVVSGRLSEGVGAIAVLSDVVGKVSSAELSETVSILVVLSLVTGNVSPVDGIKLVILETSESKAEVVVAVVRSSTAVLVPGEGSCVVGGLKLLDGAEATSVADFISEESVAADPVDCPMVSVMGEDGLDSETEVLPSTEVSSDVLGRLPVKVEEPPVAATVVSGTVVSIPEVEIMSTLVGDVILVGSGESTRLVKELSVGLPLTLVSVPVRVLVSVSGPCSAEPDGVVSDEFDTVSVTVGR